MGDRDWQAEAVRLHTLAATDAGRQPITEALLATNGRGLHELLAALDERGDHRDVEWIVYQYLGEEQRAAVLSHIDEMAPDWPRCVHVVTDVDDTLYASINDKVYPAGTVYPGALEFLTLCGRGAPVIVVTARPEVLEDRLRRRLDGFGLSDVAVLSGRVGQVFSNGAMAARKAVNLEHLMALHAGDRFVLVGDDGQGDVTLAQQAIARWGDRVAGVFIHHVMSGPVTPVDGIAFFGSYVEAATAAQTLGLMTSSDVHQVAQGARAGLASVVFESPARERAARQEFNRALAAGLDMAPLPLPDVPPEVILQPSAP